MSWPVLFVAGLFEIAWAIGLAYSEGFSRLWPSAATVVAAVASMVLLSRAIETLPVGTAYAAWTGIGAIGTATLGIVLFDESADPSRVAFLCLIVLGVVGLHATSTGH